MRGFLRIGLAAVAAIVFGGTWALAAPTDGSYATPGQIGLIAAATEHMREIDDFHNLLLVIITVISLFVLALLLWVMARFNARVNPKPAAWTHNTLIEVIWTIVPVVILGLIAVPSIRLLYKGDTIPAQVDFTIKATGNQWSWSYEYPDHGQIGFESLILKDAEAARAGEPRLLAVDNKVVVPVGKTVRLIVTAQDVIHAWTIPAFGVKIDAVPGRLNETWFKPEREGVFYGQCSELCGSGSEGSGHAYMPIAVEVVSQERFDAWIAEKTKSAKREAAPSAHAAR